MAVRIYALAKELNIDSKDLVDICGKAGVAGKGSALGSLTDEEAEKVREFLKGGGASKAKPTKSTAPLERPRDIPRTGRMPVISSKPTSSAPSAPSTPEEPTTEDIAAEATPSEVVELSPQAPTEMEERPAPLTREMSGKRAASGKVPNVGGDRKTATRKRSEGAGNGGRSRPAVKLAPMPTPVQPTRDPSETELPAQKPDMRLPAELLTPGSKPLASRVRRQHERPDEVESKRRGDVRKRAEPDAEEPKTPATARGRGRKPKATTDEEAPPAEGRPMLGGREQRQLQRRRNAVRLDTDDQPTRTIARRHKRSGTGSAAPRKDHVSIEVPCTIRQLSEAAGVQASQILHVLMDAGQMLSIASVIEPEMVELVGAELGIQIEMYLAQTLEDEVLSEIENREDDPADLVERPPVITFLGHVDHGKTSLLDRIIGIDVVSGESGGITQHIRAYSIDKDGRRISFVDTPGHEAFTEMRARGANVTDIAVLVVAADDGVMPQTEEAISHARAAEVPIVVALNKIDLPGVNINRVMQDLSTNDLLPSEWGGDVEVVKTSAATGEGLDTLLDTLLTVAELHEYKANPTRPALGTCLEAQQEAGRGVVCKLLIQNGTLKVGDLIVCGHAYGRVKAMYDTLDQNVRIAEAGPSVPVNMVGLDVAPTAGERFFVIDDVTTARAITEARAEHDRALSLGSASFQQVTLENLFDRLEQTSEVQTLNLILRADVRGSIEAIMKELSKLEHPEVKVKVLQKSVGGISEGDVTLASASQAIIIGFNVVPDEQARQLAEKRGVQIRRYDVIYKITDDLRAALEGMLRPEERVVELGRALVQQTFKISRVGTAAGCRVISGTIERSGKARVIRDSTIIGEYSIDTLRREKDDTKEVREGLECGIKLAGFNDIKEGDILEVYKIEEVGRKFES